MLTRALTFGWMIAALLTSAALRAEPAPVAAPAPLPPAVAAGTDLRAAATKEGWSTGPLVLATEPGTARPGDTVIALITLWSKSGQKQWLVRFEVEEMTEEERKNAKPQLTASISLDGGEKFVFSGRPTLALNISTLGPYLPAPAEAKTAAKNAAKKQGRALVSEEYLTLGLDRAARVRIETPAAGPAGSKPKPSIEDQKAAGGGVISLLQFFLIAQQIPGVNEIMGEVVDLPSVWTIVKSLGKFSPNLSDGNSTFAALDPAGWSLPARPLYRVPFGLGLNGKPMVNAAFFVIAPEPPLLTTAGIVGFTAESPSRKDRRMLIQVVSIERRPVPSAKPDPDNKPPAEPEKK